MGGFISKLRPGNRAAKAGASAIIGNTPLLDLSRLSQTPGVKIMAKAEYMNPSVGGCTS
jgi:threonine dehydratase